MQSQGRYCLAGASSRPRPRGAAAAEVVPAYISARTAERDGDRDAKRQDDVCLPIVEGAWREQSRKEPSTREVAV